MAAGHLRAAIRELLQVITTREGDGRTDGQLVEQFASHRHEAGTGGTGLPRVF